MWPKVTTFWDNSDPKNWYLTLGTSTILGGMMGQRFYNSGKFMPAGFIALMSVGMVLRVSLIAYTQFTSEKVKKWH